MAKIKSAKVASRPAPTAPVAPEPPPPPAPVVDETRSLRMHIGRTTGKRITVFQNETLASINAKNPMTVDDYLDALHDEFPRARGRIFQIQTEEGRAAARKVAYDILRLFNEGRHGRQTTPVPVGGVCFYSKDGQREAAPVSRRRGPAAA